MYVTENVHACCAKPLHHNERGHTPTARPAISTYTLPKKPPSPLVQSGRVLMLRERLADVLFPRGKTPDGLATVLQGLSVGTDWHTMPPRRTKMQRRGG